MTLDHRRSWLPFTTMDIVIGVDALIFLGSRPPCRRSERRSASQGPRKAMNQKAYLSTLTGAILLLGSGLQPAEASGDHSESGAGLPRQKLAAVVAPLDLRTLDQPMPRTVSPGRQFAHVVMVRTFPEPGTVGPDAVRKVEVWYDSAVRDNFVTLAVIDAAGNRIDKRDVAIDSADQTHVSTNVEALTPGTYTVRYRAISVDGFLASGSWVFEVRPK